MATEALRQFGDQVHNVGDSVIRRISQATDGDAVTLNSYDRSVLVTMDDGDDMTITMPHPSAVPVGAIVIIQLQGGASTNDLVITGTFGALTYASGDLDTTNEFVALINNGAMWLQLNSALAPVGVS